MDETRLLASCGEIKKCKIIWIDWVDLSYGFNCNQPKHSDLDRIYNEVIFIIYEEGRRLLPRFSLHKNMKKIQFKDNNCMQGYQIMFLGYGEIVL